MLDSIKKILGFIGERKKISALIATLFAAAYLVASLAGQPTAQVEGAQKECNAVAKLFGMDCGDPPAKEEE